MLLLSQRAGALSRRIGARIPMTFGPIVAGVGMALMYRVQPGAHYLTAFLPGIEVFALGLALTVAPLTATVLAAAPVENAGMASAINNDAARAAGLIAVAAVPVAVGLSGSSYLHPAAFTHGFRMAMWLCGGLCIAGGALSWFTISGERRYRRPVKQPTSAGVSEPSQPRSRRRSVAPELPAVPARAAVRAAAAHVEGEDRPTRAVAAAVPAGPQAIAPPAASGRSGAAQPALTVLQERGAGLCSFRLRPARASAPPAGVFRGRRAPVPIAVRARRRRADGPSGPVEHGKTA